MLKTITKDKIKEFKKYLISEEKSGATVEKYIRDTAAFSAWADGRELNKNDVIEYKEYLTSRYKTASVNSILSSLNSFFAYFERYDLRVKTLKQHKQIFAREEKELTREEYGRLLKAAKEKGNERLNLIIQTICSSGIRVSEDI